MNQSGSYKYLSRATLPCFLFTFGTLALLADHATAATFHIVPSESTVTLSAEISNGAPVSEQFPGSLTTNIMGTLEATASPGFISFDGGSNIDLVEQPFPFLPGDQPADLAFRAEAIFLSQTGYAAARDLLLDAINAPQAVSGSGQFSTEGMNVTFEGGTFGFVVFGLVSDTINLTGEFDSVAISTGTVEDLGGGILKITLPFEATELTDDSHLDVDVSLTLSGQIVAVIPEPSTFVLFIVGAGGLVVMGIRKRSVN